MTEEQIEKISWLNRAFYAEKKVKALESLKKHDRERAQQITANYTSNDKGKSDGRNNGVEEALLVLAESEEKYCKALCYYSVIRREIEIAIGSLNNNELESIFIYRYLEYKTMEEIAECMNYSLSTIKRKHNKGIEKVEPF